MKNTKILFLTLISVIFYQVLKACTIVDPTYDDAFKTLFAESNQSTYNGKSAQDRLTDFLNSILNQNPFNIKINNLEYRPITPNAKGEKEIEFDLLCKCTHEGKDCIINVEMQRQCQKFFIPRMTFYGAKAMITNSTSATTYDKIPQTIVLSIIDDYFENYKDYAAFYIAPSFHKLAIRSDAEKPIEEGTVMDTNLLHICIQLPIIAYFIKENNTSTEEANEIYTKNPWLQLMASRRICNDTIWDHRDASTCYDMTNNHILSPLINSENNCITSAIELLQTYAKNKEKELRDIETLLQIRIMDENSKAAAEQLKQKQFAEREAQIQDREKLLQQQQKELDRQILKLDIKKKESNKRSEETKPFKPSYQLKGKTTKYLKSLCTEDFLSKPETTDYFLSFPKDPDNSDAFAMDTEENE